MSALAKWALGYVERLRLAVFPLRPGRKEPRTANGFKDATLTPEQVAAWWNEVPQSNIGAPVPPGFVVLDVDSEAALQALGHMDLELPTTVTAKTPRGWHFWYRCSTPLQPKVGIVDGVDVRAPGSYVVVPPSRLANGGRYEWTVTPHENSYADAPDWLIELAGHKPFLVADPAVAVVNPDEVLAGISEGSRDVTLFRYACRLRALNYPRSEAEVLVVHAASLCSPPFSKAAAMRKVEQAWKYDSDRAAEKPDDSRIWTLNELLDTDFPEPQWVIKEILPEGLALVISPAKIGKSFLLGAACAAVANGMVFVQGFLTCKSRVLYLDLEQGEAMAKERWLSILGAKPRPELLSTAFKWPRMDQGGLEMLDKQLLESPDLRLVVIDVLAMFWPARGSKGGENAYIWEYRVLSQIREIAQRRNAAIVLVHHTNRSTPSDPLDKASGTNAMTGVPDTIWVLSRERSGDQGELYVTGKNVQEQKLEMSFDAALGGWGLREPRYTAHAEYYGAIAEQDLDVLGGGVQ